jgi:hypothetical protein
MSRHIYQHKPPLNSGYPFPTTTWIISPFCYPLFLVFFLFIPFKFTYCNTLLHFFLNEDYILNTLTLSDYFHFLKNIAPFSFKCWLCIIVIHKSQVLYFDVIFHDNYHLWNYLILFYLWRYNFPWIECISQ